MTDHDFEAYHTGPGEIVCRICGKPFHEPEIKPDPQPCMYIGSTACTHPQENCGPWCVDYDELPF